MVLCHLYYQVIFFRSILIRNNLAFIFMWLFMAMCHRTYLSRESCCVQYCMLLTRHTCNWWHPWLLFVCRNDISNVQGARYDNSTRNQSHHSSHSLLEQEFPTEENLSASLGSKYSHVISTVLLACAFIFFAVLGVLYISVGSEGNVMFEKVSFKDKMSKCTIYCSIPVKQRVGTSIIDSGDTAWDRIKQNLFNRGYQVIS